MRKINLYRALSLIPYVLALPFFLKHHNLFFLGNIGPSAISSYLFFISLVFYYAAVGYFPFLIAHILIFWNKDVNRFLFYIPPLAGSVLFAIQPLQVNADYTMKLFVGSLLLSSLFGYLYIGIFCIIKSCLKEYKLIKD